MIVPFGWALAILACGVLGLLATLGFGIRAYLWKPKPKLARSETPASPPPSWLLDKGPVDHHAAVRNDIALARSVLDGGKDTDLATALGFALSGKWGVSIGQAIVESRRGVRAIEKPITEFRKAAEDGDLKVWGKREGDGIYDKIEPRFWGANTIDVNALISFMPVARTVSINRHNPDDQFYDIMVNRAQVQKVWKHA